LEPYEYKTLFDFETSYWWFKGLHAILREVVQSLGLPADAEVLDAGCGTGQNIVSLSQTIACEPYGFDISPHAASFWPKRNLRRTCVSSINQIPFKDHSFDAVVSVDVLECEAVDELQAYSEIWRVMRPGGFLLLVVPAYQWLFSEEHHKAVGATRRYSKQRVKELLRQRPVTLIRMTHLFASVFPLVAAYRLSQPLMKQEVSETPKSEIKPLPKLLNEALFNMVNAERFLLRKFDLPFGSSILAVARKAD
jgi:ubiquinone/menaquinone biosynthesis C-methylase UbiE